MDLLFPHDTIRPFQKTFVDNVFSALNTRSNIVIHAPTGLGKTAASLAPALTYAIENKKTLFFLTSRHTQHEIALKTLRQIKQKHKVAFQAVDIIGKKWMCLQSNVQRLPNSEFTEFCRALREDGKCTYYSNLKKGEKLTTTAKLLLDDLKNLSPVRNQTIIDESKKHNICPYYASMQMAKKARVIIGDYFYIFHPKIREQFFSKNDIELNDAIIIVDEAHNLPSRIKDLATSRLSSNVLKRAIKEAQKHELGEVALRLAKIFEYVKLLGQKAKNTPEREIHLRREDLINNVEALGSYEDFYKTLTKHADAIREESQVSFIGAIATFLENWAGHDEGFTRIVNLRKGLKEEIISVSYRCLDPSLVAKPIIELAHSTIVMSGTLSPVHMYKEVIGCPNAKELTFPSPFPKKNKLNVIIPKTSTKFTKRGDAQYKSIAQELIKTTNAIPGNVAIFFPSYYLLNEVNKYFQTEIEKTVFVEQQQMSSSDKQEFINKFRTYKKVGAVLLGVITGSFGEGIDLPGDELKGVIVVGLPLQKPDLETKALIEYYDKKFKKGWDYGYLFPAFNKTMQSAGRCIRSEKDTGVIVFLDERYAWPNYKRCFPLDWDVKITLLYEDLIRQFFKQRQV